MPDGFALWSALGIKVPPLFSGIAGGIVGAWVDGKSGARAWFVYVICGGLTGAYLGDWASHFMPYGDSISAGFIVGGCAMILMRLLRGQIAKLDPKLAGSSTDSMEGK
jgi:hypothetical protein